MPRHEPPSAGSGAASSPPTPWGRRGLDPATDAAIRAARALKTTQGRREQQQFLLEGVRLIGDALDQDLPFYHAFITPHLLDATPRGRALGARLRQAGIPCLEISERHLTLISDTDTPAGIAAVAPLPDPEGDLPAAGGAGVGALLLDQVRDPGNLGGILRSAAAAGVSRIVTTEGSADPWAPKVVRAAAGAHLRLRLWPARPRAEVGEWLASWPAIILADGRAETTIYEVDWRLPSVLVLANEAHGHSPWLETLPVNRVAIPMRAATESLNVGAAAAILLYESRRSFLVPSR